jgi:Succinylglutamate desuccinylase / Aspartoacylase family
LFCLTTYFTAAQTFTVGTAIATPEQRALGAIEVPAGRDAAPSIPVAVFRGAKPGPVLALVSGSHGTESASIIAMEKLIQSLDPAQVCGTVIILPLVNIPSFEQKVPHVNPVDGKSMNRFYPRNPADSQTERVSWQITKQVVERCDYLIDYHGATSTKIFGMFFPSRYQQLWNKCFIRGRRFRVMQCRRVGIVVPIDPSLDGAVEDLRAGFLLGVIPCPFHEGLDSCTTGGQECDMNSKPGTILRRDSKWGRAIDDCLTYVLLNSRMCDVKHSPLHGLRCQCAGDPAL